LVSQIHLKNILYWTILLSVDFCLLSMEVFCYSAVDSVNKSILIKQDNPTTLQKIYGDTLIKKTQTTDDNIKPGYFEKEFSPFQDSAYSRALKMRLPVDLRIEQDLNKFSDGWKIQQELAKGNPWQVAVKNISSIPSEIFIPSGVEQMLYNTNLIESQYVPLMRPLNPGGGLISLNKLGTWLGLIEDVSPLIKFELDYSDNIEITIYSIQAAAVAVIFKGDLAPGSYKYVWNCRDDRGKKMPSGDYIAEIKVGNIKYIRKRIVIP
jgi:hypothetical protein